ncbi:diguanylate cyclase [Ureibacillus massiliensis 4400831 = CIP 108448 = CCUG 49529]|uniref:Diguanylate cyclase n=2 Tax=cellular organisms TaxID=131567 RepID=A0A0A3J2C5_9BACL|nr:dipeptidase PepV [Ureibacillus massiliensis]KGR91106.1 diguanylate cyclase [Ureibacillus massiliensis 4400831 = CIP 108448 = CCUG 49529]
MDWLKIAMSRKEELITECQQLIQIESVLDERNASENTPFGKGPFDALKWMLNKGNEYGFSIKIIDNVAGHIEMGQGEELLGILCHVDVVPAGSGWTYPPFKGEVVDGKLYGRGAIDDKGPTIASLLALKMVKDAGIKLNKRVRMIIGTDEESGFRCVDRYFEKEEMPTIGFAPDADFPLINAEKGIATLEFTLINHMQDDEQLISFHAGKRTNMVPDVAEAVVQNVLPDIVRNFKKFIAENNTSGNIIKEGNQFILKLTGKSSHAMEPEKGLNAAVLLSKFLVNYIQIGTGKKYVDFIVKIFGKDHYGTAIGLNYADQVSGETTLNPGIVSFDQKNGGTIQVSMRYAVTYPFDEKFTKAQLEAAKFSFTLDLLSNSAPHYVSEEDDFVQTLLAVYRKYTGDNRKPLSTGGGTYARTMKKGVAFGMLFPGEIDVAHQADEYVDVENLVKAAAIYAETIVALAGE